PHPRSFSSSTSTSPCWNQYGIQLRQIITTELSVFEVLHQIRRKIVLDFFKTRSYPHRHSGYGVGITAKINAGAQDRTHSVVTDDGRERRVRAVDPAWSDASGPPAFPWTWNERNNEFIQPRLRSNLLKSIMGHQGNCN